MHATRRRKALLVIALACSSVSADKEVRPGRERYRNPHRPDHALLGADLDAEAGSGRRGALLRECPPDSAWRPTPPP